MEWEMYVHFIGIRVLLQDQNKVKMDYISIPWKKVKLKCSIQIFELSIFCDLCNRDNLTNTVWHICFSYIDTPPYHVFPSSPFIITPCLSFCACSYTNCSTPCLEGDAQVCFSLVNTFRLKLDLVIVLSAVTICLPACLPHRHFPLQFPRTYYVVKHKWGCKSRFRSLGFDRKPQIILGWGRAEVLSCLWTWLSLSEYSQLLHSAGCTNVMMGMATI